MKYICRHEQKPQGRVAMYRAKPPRASCHVYCEDFSCYMYNYVFYITTTPYLPCNNNNNNRKELYGFYYMAITLTTGYKIISTSTIIMSKARDKISNYQHLIKKGNVAA